MTEAELLSQVREKCGELGLYTYHTDNSFGCEKGWPDLVIVGSRVLFRELKAATMLTPEQRDTGWKLKRAGQDWAVWWPKDLGNGNIERQLQAIRP